MTRHEDLIFNDVTSRDHMDTGLIELSNLDAYNRMPLLIQALD